MTNAEGPADAPALPLKKGVDDRRDPSNLFIRQFRINDQIHVGVFPG
jgi:hypothetical protein